MRVGITGVMRWQHGQRNNDFARAIVSLLRSVAMEFSKGYGLVAFGPDRGSLVFLDLWKRQVVLA